MDRGKQRIDTSIVRIKIREMRFVERMEISKTDSLLFRSRAVFEDYEPTDSKSMDATSKCSWNVNTSYRVTCTFPVYFKLLR